MAIERDDAFTSTGVGGMNQQRDFETGTMGAGRTLDPDSGQAQPMTARAKDAVSAAGHKAADRVQERLADQMSRATGQLESVASSLRTAGEHMPADNGIGRYMMQAASQVDNLATFLNNREVSELVDEVEGFARRQPAVFLGGAFALGILGARFLRSSRQNMDLGYDRDSRRGYRDGEDTFRGGVSSTSFRAPAESSRTGFEPGYGGSSAGGDTDLSSGYAAGSGSSSSYAGTSGGRAGMGSSSSRDLASDLPNSSGAGRSSTGGMAGAGTMGSNTTGSGASTLGQERSLGESLSSDDSARRSTFGNDSLSARPGPGVDRVSREDESGQRPPDYL